MVEGAADWNPANHPRGPDGKFIERPWDIDMGLDDISSTDTHNLVEFLADVGGNEPDMDTVLSDDSIRIDGIPDDIDSVSELKTRMRSPTKDADVPSNPVEAGQLESGDVVRAGGEPFTVMDVGDSGVLQVKDKHGEQSELDTMTLPRNTVDRYNVNDISELPSVESGDGPTTLDALPQSTVTPGELEQGDYFIGPDGNALEFREWNTPDGEAPDDPDPADARVRPVSGTRGLQTEWPDNVQRIDVDEQERVLGAMTMDEVPQFERAPSQLRRGQVFTFPDMDDDDPESWYEVVRTSGRGENKAITIKKNDDSRTQTRREAGNMPDEVTVATLSNNAGLDEHPANVSARQEQFRQNNELPGIDVPKTTGYLVNTKADEKGVDVSEYEGQPRELAKALVANTERDTMTKGAWEAVQPVMEDRIDKMKDDRLALQFAAHLKTLDKKDSPGGSVSRAGTPDDTVGQDTIYRISGSSSSTYLASHEMEHAIIDSGGGPTSVNTGKANQFNSGREFSFRSDLQGDTLKNMRDYFFTGSGLFGEAGANDELVRPASEALQFEEWNERVENEVLGLSNVVDFRGVQRHDDDPAEYWREIDRGDAIEYPEFGVSGRRAVVTDIEREADESSAHKVTVRVKAADSDNYRRSERTLWVTTRGEIDADRSDVDGVTSKRLEGIKKDAVSEQDFEQVRTGDGYAAEQLRTDFSDDPEERLYEYTDAANEAFYRQAIATTELDESDASAYYMGSRGYSATNAHETVAVAAGEIARADEDDTSLVNTLATRHPRFLAAYAAQYDLPEGFRAAMDTFASELEDAAGDRDGTDELAAAVRDLLNEGSA